MKIPDILNRVPFLGGRSLTSLFIMGIRVVMMAAKFILSIFLARYMGLESLGLYGLLAAAVSSVPVLFKAGMQPILSREAVIKSPDHLARSLFHYYTAVLGVYALIVPCVIAGSVLGGYGIIPLLVLLLIIIEHIVTDWFYLMISLKKPIRANIMLFVQAGAWMLTFMLGAWFWEDLRTIPVLLMFWAGGGVLALATAIGVMHLLPWRAAIKQGLDKQWYRKHWTKHRFFYLGDIANVGASYIDRYIVGFFLGLELTGVYVLFWQMANAVYTLVSTGVLQLYRPRLIETRAKESAEKFQSLYRESLKKITLSAAALSISVALVAPLVTGWTDKPLALSYIPLLWILLCAMSVRACAEGTGSAMLACFMDKALIGSSILQLAGASLLIFLGLHISGIYGAAIGNFLAYILLLFYRQYALKATYTKYT